MTATEYVVLVDRDDREIGQEEKLKAHELGLLHRAFSVFIFQGEESPITEDSILLLQQRAFSKYHSGGLWTNTCCSHPRANEDIIDAGQRRLKEELGITAKLSNHGHFHYIAHFENGLCENELDYVLSGFISNDTTFKPSAEEVASTRWVTIKELQKELHDLPHLFTPWLKLALQKIVA